MLRPHRLLRSGTTWQRSSGTLVMAALSTLMRVRAVVPFRLGKLVTERASEIMLKCVCTLKNKIIKRLKSAKKRWKITVQKTHSFSSLGRLVKASVWKVLRGFPWMFKDSSRGHLCSRG